MFYRKVFATVYEDERLKPFMKEPHPGFLYVYLLTGPFSTLVPGLTVASVELLAAAIGWKNSALVEREARKLAKAGLLVRNDGGCVWFLPDAAAMDQPTNPNTVIGWRRTLDDLRDQKFASEVLRPALVNALNAKHPAWTAFLYDGAATVGEGLANPSASQPAQKQEQEQEQEQEQKQEQKQEPEAEQMTEGVLNEIVSGLVFRLGKAGFDADSQARFANLMFSRMGPGAGRFARDNVTVLVASSLAALAKDPLPKFPANMAYSILTGFGPSEKYLERAERLVELHRDEKPDDASREIAARIIGRHRAARAAQRAT